MTTTAVDIGWSDGQPCLQVWESGRQIVSHPLDPHEVAHLTRRLAGYLLLLHPPPDRQETPDATPAT